MRLWGLHSACYICSFQNILQSSINFLLEKGMGKVNSPPL